MRCSTCGILVATPPPTGATPGGGCCIRADGLNRVQGDDLERLAALGLRTVVDLRTPNERVERGSFPVESMPVDYHHFPVLQQTWEGQTLDATIDGAEFLTARYREMLDVGAEAIAGALTRAGRRTGLPGGVPLRRGQGPHRACWPRWCSACWACPTRPSPPTTG